MIQCDIAIVEADALVHPTNASFYLGGEVGSCLNLVLAFLDLGYHFIGTQC